VNAKTKYSGKNYRAQKIVLTISTLPQLEPNNILTLEKWRRQ